MAPAGPLPDGATAALFTIVVVTLIVVYHGGAVLAVLQKFPVFSNNPIRRATSIIDFALPALGAIGIERVLSSPRRAALGRSPRVAVVWALGATGFVVLLAKVISLAGPSGNRGWVATHALVGVASAVVTAAVLWYAAAWRGTCACCVWCCPSS